MKDLQARLDDAVRGRLERRTRRAAPGVPPPQVLVEAPGACVEHGDLAQPFHTASTGKNFLAVLIGRLVQAGALTLATPLGEVGRIPDLPAVPGVDPHREITVEHLLAHRTGLPDPFLPPRGHTTAWSPSSPAGRRCPTCCAATSSTPPACRTPTRSCPARRSKAWRPSGSAVWR
ncbi:serine hydrolase [Ornithinimicrobium panacihumi]|uniref:serine hydrolase n=1 Tax=Ornithinimicrobium panacihumi TaxID=2008449 RepID=UPI003F8871F6